MTRILCVGVAVILSACHQVADYPQQKAMTKAPTKTASFVEVRWMHDVDDVVKACPSLVGGTYYGCANSDGVCTIYLQQPIDFNDVPRLAVLGHEVLHCLGAEHQ